MADSGQRGNRRRARTGVLDGITGSARKRQAGKRTGTTSRGAVRGGRNDEEDWGSSRVSADFGSWRMPSTPSRQTPLVPPREARAASEEEQRREREVKERTQGAGGDANGDGARPSQVLEKRSPPAFSGVRLEAYGWPLEATLKPKQVRLSSKEPGQKLDIQTNRRMV